MIVRAALCALDWNWNVDRPQKLDDFGEPQWKEKVNRFLYFFIYKTIRPKICSSGEINPHCL